MTLDQERGPEGQHRRLGLRARSRRWCGDGERDGAVPRRSRPRPPTCSATSAPTTRPRSSARRRGAASASCSRSYAVVAAATTASGNDVESDVGHVHEGQARRRRACSSRTSSCVRSRSTPTLQQRGRREGRRAAARGAAEVRAGDRAAAGRHHAHPGAGHRRLAADPRVRRRGADDRARRPERLDGRPEPARRSARRRSSRRQYLQFTYIQALQAARELAEQHDAGPAVRQEPHAADQPAGSAARRRATGSTTVDRRQRARQLRACGASRRSGAGRRRGSTAARKPRSRAAALGVGPAVAHVAGAGLDELRVRLDAEQLAERSCSTSSSVDAAPPAMLYTWPAHAAAGRGRGGEVRGDDVGDVGEVARLEPVAVHDRVAAVEQRVDEERDHRRVGRVGALPRAVHVEVAQRDRLEPVELGEDAAVLLGRELRHRVRRAGMQRLAPRWSAAAPRRRRRCSTTRARRGARRRRARPSAP